MVSVLKTAKRQFKSKIKLKISFHLKVSNKINYARQSLNNILVLMDKRRFNTSTFENTS